MDKHIVRWQIIGNRTVNGRYLGVVTRNFWSDDTIDHSTTWDEPIPGNTLGMTQGFEERSYECPPIEEWVFGEMQKGGSAT